MKNDPVLFSSNYCHCEGAGYAEVSSAPILNYVANPAFKRRICCIAQSVSLLYDFHLSQEKKLLNEALNVGIKELQE